MRVRIGKLAQAHLGDEGIGTLAGFRAAQPTGCQQREHDVLAHRLPRGQLVKLLKHHHTIWPRALHALAVQQNLALARCKETTQRLEQTALAAARCAQQHKAVALVHIQTHAVRGLHLLLGRAVDQAHVLNLQQRLGHSSWHRLMAAMHHRLCGSHCSGVTRCILYPRHGGGLHTRGHSGYV